MAFGSPTRVVHCQDAVAWLKSHKKIDGASFVASLPDYSEFPALSLAQWKDWFVDTATLIMASTADNDVSIFFQSDIKSEGTWIDKGYLILKAAEKSGVELLWHKIACRAPAGQATFGRPGYSHLLCFSKNLRLKDLNGSTADVLADVGEKTWARGMGIDVCTSVVRFVATHTKSHTVINPFCGEGALLAAANAEGLHAIGIERSAKRAETSRRQQLAPDRKSFLVST